LFDVKAAKDITGKQETLHLLLAVGPLPLSLMGRSELLVTALAQV